MSWLVVGISAAISATGAVAGNNTLSDARQNLLGLAQFNPLDFQGPGGTASFGGGGAQFQLSPQQQAIQQQLGQGTQGFLGGGLFNDPSLQQHWRKPPRPIGWHPDSPCCHRRRSPRLQADLREF